MDPVAVTVENCPGILLCLCQQWHTLALARTLPPPAVFKALTESEGDKTGLCHTAKPNPNTIPTVLIHGTPLSFTVLNPSIAWPQSLSLFLVPLAFSLLRDKAVVEKVAHPGGWKLVSHPTQKSCFHSKHCHCAQTCQRKLFVTRGIGNYPLDLSCGSGGEACSLLAASLRWPIGRQEGNIKRRFCPSIDTSQCLYKCFYFFFCCCVALILPVGDHLEMLWRYLVKCEAIT